MALIFKDDKEFHHRSCHVVGFTAFGTLWCWSDQYLDFKIDLPFSLVYCDSLTMPGWKPTASADHIASGIVPDREDADFLDNAGEPMFDRCVEAYGRPSSTECFGFVPALAIAGAFGPLQRVENIKRMSALEHFTILAQLEQFHLVVPGPDDIIPVRAIG
ncbi:hypothetical protein BLM15_10960 [Bosea sp. Tri-49]|nr:hypothetical protein BLM15_10960 [Bosea sp. Tri-49]